MADILLSNKSVEDFFPPGTYHKQYPLSIAQKLTNCGAHDFRSMATYEFNVFEHVMLHRFFYKLLEQCYRRKCHEDLYLDLLQKSSVHIFNTRTLDQAVNRKLKAGKKISEETKADATKGV